MLTGKHFNRPEGIIGGPQGLGRQPDVQRRWNATNPDERSSQQPSTMQGSCSTSHGPAPITATIRSWHRLCPPAAELITRQTR